MHLSEGVIIAEHYKLVSLLGQGSFGDVWLAHNLLADINVAIKFYGTLDQKGIEEFRNEFKIAYKLRHPNLLNINHFDVYENCPYLVMPYCENGSVSRQIGQMPESEIWKFVLDVSEGLAFLHSQHPPVVHQDIKPDNILITSDGRYLISDFGISRSFRTKMSHTNNVSSSGTIAYMGPERFSEKPMVVLASDIWAFGMTLYELMTGNVLWEGMGGCVQLNGARLPVICGTFSKELSQLVTSCLAAETWNRPTASQIHEYASAYIQKRTIPPLPVQEAAQPDSVTTNQSSPIYSEPSTYSSHHSQSDSLSAFLKTPVFKRGLLIAAAVIIGILLIINGARLISSISEEEDFLSCRTLQDYERFIQEHPSSSYVETARQRITTLTPPSSVSNQEYTKQPVENTVPQKKETKEATTSHSKDIILFEKKQVVDQPVSSPKKTPSTNSMTADDRAFYSCVSSNDFHTYLTNYPNGRHRKAAEARLTAILNQTNGNEININSNALPAERGIQDIPSRSGGVMRQRSAGIQVGTNSFRGGARGGVDRGPQRGVVNRGGGSSHRHSN
jgi:serine/threonine protein kinase